MNKRLVLEPTLSGSDVIVQFTDRIPLDKTVFVRVPNDFSAFIGIDEKFVARLSSCKETSLLEYLGKKEKGKTVQLAFFRKGEIPASPWGFGNVAILFDGKTFHVGANGRFQVEMVDPMKLIKVFGSDQHLFADAVVAKTKPLVVNVIRDLLIEMFSKGTINPRNALAYSNELKRAAVQAFEACDPLLALGFRVKALNVIAIHVPEEELDEKTGDDSIHEQIASSMASIKDECMQLAQTAHPDTELQNELSHLREEVAALTEKQDLDSVLDEIDNLRQEMHETIENAKPDAPNFSPITRQLNALKKQMDELKGEENRADLLANVKTMVEEMGKTIENKIDSKLADAQEAIIKAAFDRDQDALPLYASAEKEFLAKLKITTDLLLDKAEGPGDYATVASMIYSDVEDNLISKFGVPHREKSFYMTQSEYVALKNTYLNSWHIPREVRFRNDPEVYVEMPIEIRFAKAGFSAGEAKEAAANWSALNMMRHRSPENRQRLDSFLSSCGMDEKDFLRSVLRTFREKGVYTRD